MTRTTILAARAHAGVIGANGRLPWRMSSDLEHFKRTTLGHCVIVGRITFDELPVKLLGRFVVVLSRSLPRDAYRRVGLDHVTVASSVASALRTAYAVGANTESDRVFVIGGASVYREFLPLADDAWITEIDASVPGDAHLHLDPAAWSHPTLLGTIESGPRDEHEASIVAYERLVPARSL